MVQQSPTHQCQRHITQTRRFWRGSRTARSLHGFSHRMRQMVHREHVSFVPGQRQQNCRTRREATFPRVMNVSRGKNFNGVGVSQPRDNIISKNIPALIPRPYQASQLFWFYFMPLKLTQVNII